MLGTDQLGNRSFLFAHLLLQRFDAVACFAVLCGQRGNGFEMLLILFGELLLDTD